MKQIKNWIFHILFVFLCALSMPLTIFAAEGSLTGAGTKESPYLIKSVNDLDIVKDAVRNGNPYKQKVFRLEQDIVLPASWNPIGELKAGTDNGGMGRNILPFSGILDGNHHTITFGKNSQPLFGYVREAEVKNLNIYGSYINGYGLVDHYVVDYGKDGSANSSDDPAYTIMADHVTIKSGSRIHQSGFIGGYASGANHANFTECLIEPDVIIGCNADGTSAGLSEIGSFGGALNGTITNCESYATVYGKDNVGGIAGIRGQSTNVFTVEGCKFHGTIKASGNNVGGILGSGYYMYNAPNAFGAVIKNCSVNGNVSGKENVGGIFGAEAGIDQAWDNGIGQIIANNFSGKVAGEKNVGAIIGYIRALNVNNQISNNTYTSACGCNTGIGKVTHVDTDKVPFGMRDNVFYFDSSKSTSYSEEEWNQIYEVVDGDWKDTNRYPGKAIAKPNYNRSDDPLGEDLEKLVKCSDVEAEPLCHGIDLISKGKDTYKIGESLDLSGYTFKAHWTQGKADTTISGKDVITGPFDNSSRGSKTIRVYYGAGTTTITVNVIKDPSLKINVNFSLYGDDIHDAEKDKIAHVQSMQTLKTWIAPKTYSVSANANVKDLLEMVLVLNHMSCSNPKGNYVESITKDGVTLGEFDNGSMSGWMYTLNGKHPLLAVNEQYLEDGDVIVFHYTDNYYYEEGSQGYEEAKKVLSVTNKIKAIGTVSYTTASKSKIDDARTSYNALTAGQKTLVVAQTYGILTGAEQKYQQLKTAAEKAAAEKKAAEEAKKAEAALIKKYTPVKITLKSVKKAGSGKVKVTWKKVTAATGYELYMSNSKTAGYKKIATIKKNKTVTYTKKGLKKKKTYYFKVRTYRKVGAKYYYGAYSNIKGLKLK